MGKPPPIGHEQFPYVAKNPVSHFFYSVYESGHHKNNHEDNRHSRTTNTQLSILSVARSLPELGGMQRQRRAARETAFTPTEKGLSSPSLLATVDSLMLSSRRTMPASFTLHAVAAERDVLSPSSYERGTLAFGGVSPLGASLDTGHFLLRHRRLRTSRGSMRTPPRALGTCSNNCGRIGQGCSPVQLMNLRRVEPV